MNLGRFFEQIFIISIELKKGQLLGYCVLLESVSCRLSPGWQEITHGVGSTYVCNTVRYGTGAHPTTRPLAKCKFIT